jgi:hypothetical protein
MFAPYVSWALHDMMAWHGNTPRNPNRTEKEGKKDVPAKSTIVSANVLYCLSSGVEV